jgi:hypothetical protein
MEPECSLPCSLDPALSQMKPVHISKTYVSKVSINIVIIIIVVVLSSTLESSLDIHRLKLMKILMA